MMPQRSANEPRICAVVTSRTTAARTVERAVRGARDLHAETGATVAVGIRIVVGADGSPAAEGTEAHVEEVLSALEPHSGWDVDVTDLRLGVAEGADATGLADALADRLAGAGVARIVLADDGVFSAERLRDRLGTTAVELVPVDRSPARRRLLHPGGVRRLVTVFGLSYVFYLAVGGFAGGLDYLTGAVSAAVVAISLSHVALREEPTISRTGVRLARTVVFVPVLLWEVVKANFAIAYVILHPRLPIDPSTGVIETDTRGGFERMVLANTITLTPGTLTVDVRGREFVVHSLTAAAREDLSGGRLQRLVSWVFHGASPPAETTGGRGEGK